MSEFAVLVEARIEARNLASAQRKKDELLEVLKRKRVQYVYVHLKGQEGGG